MVNILPKLQLHAHLAFEKMQNLLTTVVSTQPPSQPPPHNATTTIPHNHLPTSNNNINNHHLKMEACTQPEIHLSLRQWHRSLLRHFHHSGFDGIEEGLTALLYCIFHHYTIQHHLHNTTKVDHVKCRSGMWVDVDLDPRTHASTIRECVRCFEGMVHALGLPCTVMDTAETCMAYTELPAGVTIISTLSTRTDIDGNHHHQGGWTSAHWNKLNALMNNPTAATIHPDATTAACVRVVMLLVPMTQQLGVPATLRSKFFYNAQVTPQSRPSYTHPNHHSSAPRSDTTDNDADQSGPVLLTNPDELETMSHVISNTWISHDIHRLIRDTMLVLRRHPAVSPTGALDARCLPNMVNACQMVAAIVFGQEFVLPDHVGLVLRNVVGHRVSLREGVGAHGLDAVLDQAISSIIKPF